MIKKIGYYIIKIAIKCTKIEGYVQVSLIIIAQLTFKIYFIIQQAMQATTFVSDYYQIICKAGEQALRVQENQAKKSQKSKIIGSQQNSHDNNQIFILEKTNNDEYEIISCTSSLVFDEDGKEVKLKTGKQHKSQLFHIVLAPVQAFHKYYWIKTDKKGNEALCLQGTLRTAKFDPNSSAQLFRFDQVNNSTIQGSAFLVNNLSNKALDVPNATFKAGERIVQWEKNKKWQQRWRFVKQGKGVIIQSVLTEQVVDIAEERRDNGAKVIQWQKTGGSNQQWFPEPAGNGLFKFRSCHEPNLFLAIKKQDKDNGGVLEVSNQENPSMYWRIQGAQP